LAQKLILPKSQARNSTKKNPAASPQLTQNGYTKQAYLSPHFCSSKTYWTYHVEMETLQREPVFKGFSRDDQCSYPSPETLHVQTRLAGFLATEIYLYLNIKIFLEGFFPFIALRILHTVTLHKFSHHVAKISYWNLVASMGSEIYESARRTTHDLFCCAIYCELCFLNVLYGVSDCFKTGGYDGSMLNGLNILPSYTDYFNLNAATTGLNTASVFIGGFFGPMVSGIAADRLGRRPAIFWGSVVTLIGILLQTAAQNVAMFVVARIVLGFGSAVSGIAAAVYLAETFPSRWRAWGVGLLNDFY
jgi:hypothetical protein